MNTEPVTKLSSYRARQRHDKAQLSEADLRPGLVVDGLLGDLACVTCEGQPGVHAEYWST